ncbi:hypothetical protein RY831_09185 [Noviherbaspirillum sp. CPCC 100848]|uniref:Uncharacterized protein n=1 Tax=Noviherbaspirillum album TaxID=3080276 RepID=A0ABU6J6S8_9BURK|nr:hypothetical protein [Noviherbaspirillum sp. CPCC 100848]MEC4719321.1 hypothetical protein [Noviherbaspirillum sp. CPCC 100848]
MTGLVEAEADCFWDKARRRDMASHGKKPQRRTRDNAHRSGKQDRAKPL